MINDTHFGIRNDNKNFHEYFKRFYEDVFFPFIDDNGIDRVIHLGDLVDRRKYIQFMTSNLLHEIFMKPLFDRNVKLDIMCGNHDTQYRHTNEFNAIKTLYGHSKYDFRLFENPKTVDIDGTDVMIIPWLCQDNMEKFYEEVSSTKAQVAMGHLDLMGFEENKGHISDHGMDKDVFKKFDVVLSGHFHHKSSVGNIHYLGSPCQFSWSDYSDQKGFHTFDTETRELEFIKNPYEIFKKFHYDDSRKDAESMLDFDEDSFYGTYVKVIIRSKTKNALFDSLMNKLEASGVADMQVVEDHLNLDVISEDDLVDEAQDTLTILKKYIRQMEIGVDKTKVENFARELYEEALTIE